MATRHSNHRLAKLHRNYSVEEVAKLYGVHRNTVREWIKRGLPTNDGKRPTLILGRDLAAFLQAPSQNNLGNPRTPLAVMRSNSGNHSLVASTPSREGRFEVSLRRP